MRLFGNDMDETTTVLEAGLGWIVGWKKADFNGADVLRAQKVAGVERTLVGLEMIDRGDRAPWVPVYSSTARPLVWSRAARRRRS